MFAHTNTHTSVHLKWHKTESITRFVCFVIVVGDEKCTAEVPTGSHIVNSAHFISQYKCCCYSENESDAVISFYFLFRYHRDTLDGGRLPVDLFHASELFILTNTCG